MSPVLLLCMLLVGAMAFPHNDHPRSKRAAAAHQMSCNAGMTNAQRYTFVNNHNKYRELVAQGKAPNKCGALPKAKNMYKLIYDCDLEAKARTYTDTCGTGSLPQGVVGMTYSGSGMAAQADNLIQSILTAFATKVQTIGIAADVVYNNNNLFSWAQMANGESTKIGCAYTACSGDAKMTIACAYDKIGYYTGSTVYEPGTPCTSDAECTTYDASTCDTSVGLCEWQMADDGTSTMCGAQKFLTDYQRNLVLNWHNKLRTSLAKGLERDGNGTAYAPKAKQMLKMVYDCAVEASAKSWADGCQFVHSTAAQRNNYGENLYMTSDKTQDKPTSLEMASKLWWKELVDFGVGMENNLTQAVFDRGVGHYTQMAWEKTNKLGCSSINCSDKTLVVCQYSPAGNMLNNFIYTVGDPCTNDSGCPGTQTCSVADAMCVVV